MFEPPLGICVRCRLIRVIDGDTVVVQRIGSDFHWHIRFLGCWVDDGSLKDQLARDFVRTSCAEAGTIRVFVPLDRVQNLSGILTMERVLGLLFADGLDLAAAIVERGWGTAKKPAQRKERSVTHG